MTDADTSPTLLRRRLAGELRRLRQEAGYTRDSAAKALGWSTSKMNYIESARFKRINQHDVRAMLELYGVTDRIEHEAFIRLVADSKKRGWVQQYNDVLPEWFQSYVGFEAEVSSLQTYEPLLVPGLLQTADYARAVTTAGLIDGSQETIDRSVAARMDRQKMLADMNRKLWLVLDEGVLHRPVGGSKVMREQLNRLVEIASQPNITLQVVPYGAGAYPAMYGPFIILTFPNPRDRDLVYIDFETGSVYREEPEELERYVLVFNHMRAAALSIANTMRLVSDVAERLP